MSRTDKELDGVSLLGNQNTQYKLTYSPEVLETFENKHKDNDYVVTFDAYEFTSLCVAGDTLIDVARDLDKYPNGIAIKDLVGTEGYVFGVDDKTLQPVARRYSDVRCTRENAKVVKITIELLDRTEEVRKTVSIHCTPDHLVLVKEEKENKWIEAQDLQHGMKVIVDRWPGDYLSEVRGIDRNTLILDDVYKRDKDYIIDDAYGEVVDVVEDGYQDVYNMEVEDVHNFFANGVTLHNCPKTGQPDFAKVVISYIPNERMVESKSLKLYLFSFRNQGDFHEDCINMIGKDLVKLMDPKYLEVRGVFSPRGGCSIFPFYTYSTKGYEHIEEQRKIDVMRDASNRAIRFDR